MGSCESTPLPTGPPKKEECIVGYAYITYTDSKKVSKNAIAEYWILKEDILTDSKEIVNPETAIYFAKKGYVADILTADKNTRIMANAMTFNKIPIRNHSWVTPTWYCLTRSIIEDSLNGLGNGYYSNGKRMYSIVDKETHTYDFYDLNDVPSRVIGRDNFLSRYNQMKILEKLPNIFSQDMIDKFNSGKTHILYRRVTSKETFCKITYTKLGIDIYDDSDIEGALKNVLKVPFTMSILRDRLLSGYNMIYSIEILRVIEPSVKNA